MQNQTQTQTQTQIWTFKLTLSKQARSNGGDKYIGRCDSIDDDRERAFYLPHVLSRQNGTPINDINLDVRATLPDDQNWIRFGLIKRAKGSGDDRYSPEDGIWTGDIYLPKLFREGGDETVWLKTANNTPI